MYRLPNSCCISTSPVKSVATIAIQHSALHAQQSVNNKILYILYIYIIVSSALLIAFVPFGDLLFARPIYLSNIVFFTSYIVGCGEWSSRHLNLECWTLLLFQLQNGRRASNRMNAYHLHTQHLNNFAKHPYTEWSFYLFLYRQNSSATNTIVILKLFNIIIKFCKIHRTIGWVLPFTQPKPMLYSNFLLLSFIFLGLVSIKVDKHYILQLSFPVGSVEFLHLCT